MKIYLTLFTLVNCILLFGEPNIRVYHEQTAEGFSIYADNQEYCPVSIEMKFDLTNLGSSNGNNKVFVIPPRTTKHLITDLETIKENKPYKFSFFIVTNFGDHLNNDYDKDFEYQLPFRKGQSFLINQGYNGSASHRNLNALDFDMPIGTEITAVRGGIVTETVDTNSKSCPEEKCNQYNNFIRVFHTDGTFAEYTHIKKDGALVKAGDEVKAGDVIALSGNVGWSSGPHLHLVIYQQKIKERVSLETKFLVGDGNEVAYLKEKHAYHKKY